MPVLERPSRLYLYKLPSAGKVTQDNSSDRITLATAPGTQPRNPAPNVSAKTFILHPKAAAQRRLLIKQDKQVEGDPDQNSILQNPQVPKQQPLPQDHRQHRHVHGIPYI